MIIGSLFTGAAMLDRAVEEVTDGRVAWHCESDPAASRLLAQRFPGIRNHGDITKVDWAEVEPVDILCGGFPCQNVSTAGLRTGIRPGSRSGLWAYFAKAVDSLKPGLVVIENVRGLLSAEAHRDVEPVYEALDKRSGNGKVRLLRAAGAVLGDLAEIGYDARWTTLSASGVGAPHQRERVFIVAHPAGAELPDPRPVTAMSPAGRLLPTPAVRDHKGHGPAGMNRNSPNMSAIADLFPTGEYDAVTARWASLTRPCPPPDEPNTVGGRRLNPAFSEWVMGWPDGWATAVPGLSRADRLRIIGNGVVPQQAVAALRSLLGHHTPLRPLGADLLADLDRRLAVLS